MKLPHQRNIIVLLILSTVPLKAEIPAVAAGEQISVTQAAALIDSTDFDKRMRACQTLLNTYQQSEGAQKDQLRTQLSGQIISILSSPVAANENWTVRTTPRNLAIKLAGELQLQEVIPALIRLLKPLPGQVSRHNIDILTPTTQDHLFIAPAASALIKIGPPVEKSLRAALSDTNDSLKVKPSKEKRTSYLEDAVKISNIKYIPNQIAAQLPAATSISKLSIDQAGAAVSSDNEDQRRQAFRVLVAAYLKGNADERQKAVTTIVRVLEAPVVGREDWSDNNTPRNLACQAAGKAGMVKAIPALIKLFALQPGQYVPSVGGSFPIVGDGLYVGFPALALVEIGKPAISALKHEQSANSDRNVQANIQWIMEMMHGLGKD